MMRVMLICLLSLLTVATANAAPRGEQLQLGVTEEDLPIPPIPPDQDPDYLAAPVPNNGISAPKPWTTTNTGPEVTPGFYQPKDYNLGQGYLPGSTVQGEQEHRAKPMPSLNLKVPLQ